jgi:hypothetical protein
MPRIQLLSWLLASSLLLALQAGCGVAMTTVFGQRTRQTYVLRPDSSRAQLTCDGQPCSEIHGAKTTEKASLWAFAAGVAAETGCFVFAGRINHRAGDSAPHDLAYPCGGLLALDLGSALLGIPLGGLFFSDNPRNRFDEHVELTLDGKTVKLNPGFDRGATVAPGIFSAERAVQQNVTIDAERSKRALCGALRSHRDGGAANVTASLAYEVLPLDGDEAQSLRNELLQQLQLDLGPPTNPFPRRSVLRIEPTLSRSPEALLLRVRILTAANGVEISSWSAAADSIEELRQQLRSHQGLYGDPCSG